MSESLPFAWIGEHEVAQRLTYERLFPAIEKAFVDGPQATPRVSLPYQGQSADSTGTLLLMSAILPDTLAGVKIVTHNVNRKSGIIKYVYVAFDPVSGAILALIDGEAMNTRRTAAVSVVAATYMSTVDSARILVVGTGPVAFELVKAYAVAYPSATLHLWGRRWEAARAIATKLAATGVEVSAETGLDDLVRTADIVSCATGSLVPLIKGELLKSGAHLDLIGGFTPAMREANDDTFRRNPFIVVDNVSALREAGDLCHPIAAGLVRPDSIVTLESLFSAPRVARNDQALTLFKSVGNSVFDLATARVLVEHLRNPPSDKVA